MSFLDEKPPRPPVPFWLAPLYSPAQSFTCRGLRARELAGAATPPAPCRTWCGKWECQ